MKIRICLFNLSWLLFLCVSFSGCISTPKFKGERDFCGMVVDENNKPVSGYLVNCKKSGILCGSALTNESGIFVIQNLKSGKYVFEGRKNNCTDIKEVEVDFYDRNSILCCKVCTARGLFERVDKMISGEDYANARKELKFLRGEKNSYVEKMIIAYRGLISLYEKDRKSAEIDIKRLKKSKDKDFMSFAEKLEVKLNESKS